MMIKAAHVFLNGRHEIKSVSFFDGKIIFMDTEDEPEYTLLPGFVNAHTHIGDSFIVDVPRMDIKSLVGPGGFKQRMLETASRKTIIDGMKRSVRVMESENTRAFFDFREGGRKGLELIRSLKMKKITPMVLSRPSKNIVDYDEIEYLLDRSAGIGLSSISDYDYSFIKEISKIVKERGKIFAIHASERVREDIDKILELKPDFLIHMHMATDSDLEKVRERGIGIVICPRSGLFFNIHMDMGRFIGKGINVALGTDNGMISIPSMRIEMLVSSLLFDVNAVEIIRAATVAMDKFLPDPDTLLIFRNSPGEIVKNPFLKPLKVQRFEKIEYKG